MPPPAIRDVLAQMRRRPVPAAPPVSASQTGPGAPGGVLVRLPAAPHASRAAAPGAPPIERPLLLDHRALAETDPRHWDELRRRAAPFLRLRPAAVATAVAPPPPIPVRDARPPREPTGPPPGIAAIVDHHEEEVFVDGKSPTPSFGTAVSASPSSADMDPMDSATTGTAVMLDSGDSFEVEMPAQPHEPRVATAAAPATQRARPAVAAPGTARAGLHDLPPEVASQIRHGLPAASELQTTRLRDFAMQCHSTNADCGDMYRPFISRYLIGAYRDLWRAEQADGAITCEKLDRAKQDAFSLLLHQKLMRDYLNVFSPYRGSVLVHGLGSGKTCTSIAIAEGMMSMRRTIVMTPASLRANYIEQLKSCGDSMFKKHQHWTWIEARGERGRKTAEMLARVLGLPVEFVQKRHGAFLVDSRKRSNLAEIEQNSKMLKKLNQQLDRMIAAKYIFISYNGMRSKEVEALLQSAGPGGNFFDDATVIIDEAHNFVSLISNKLERMTRRQRKTADMDVADDVVPDASNARDRAGDRPPPDHAAQPPPKRARWVGGMSPPVQPAAAADVPAQPKTVAMVMYDKLRRARNARVVLLTGTPLINRANELAILFNIIRGDVASIRFKINPNSTGVAALQRGKNVVHKLLHRHGITTADHIVYDPQEFILSITRNPYGFQNTYLQETGDRVAVHLDAAAADEVKQVHNDRRMPRTEAREAVHQVLAQSFPSDSQFKKQVLNALKAEQIQASGLEIKYLRPLPDFFDPFVQQYVNIPEQKLINTNKLESQILGYTSYFKSAQENLLPRYTGTLGQDYLLHKCEMSSMQFKIYIDMRTLELNREKNARKKKRAQHRAQHRPQHGNVGANIRRAMQETNSSYYRIFSRMACNYALLHRPVPGQFKQNDEADIQAATETAPSASAARSHRGGASSGRDSDGTAVDTATDPGTAVDSTVSAMTDEDAAIAGEEDGGSEEVEAEVDRDLVQLLESALDEDADAVRAKEDDAETQRDLAPELRDRVRAERVTREGNAAVPDIGEDNAEQQLERMGGKTYQEAVAHLKRQMRAEREQYFSEAALRDHSPKFLQVLHNIRDPKYVGNHLVYSQFRSLEGIEFLSLVLETNGFARFRVRPKPGVSGDWELVRSPGDAGKPMYALYTGTESVEEREIVRKVYNGEWDEKGFPTSLRRELLSVFPDAEHNMWGKVIRVFMITSSGSEGINLFNTRFVHLVDPFWHAVRHEQVIGRARRICSHKRLPKEFQTVQVFAYLATFSPAQLSNPSVEARLVMDSDRSRLVPSTVHTTDQYMDELSTIKKTLNDQLLQRMKNTAFDRELFQPAQQQRA